MSLIHAQNHKPEVCRAATWFAELFGEYYPMTSELRRLGEFVAERRKELGLSQDEVQASGGPSDSTLTKIEAGTGPMPQNPTLRKLDAGLRWVDGSAKTVLAGGDPTPIPNTHVRAHFVGDGQLTATVDRITSHRILEQQALARFSTVSLIDEIRRRATTAGHNGHAGISGTGPPVEVTQDDLDLAQAKGGRRELDEQRAGQDSDAYAADPEGPEGGA